MKPEMAGLSGRSSRNVCGWALQGDAEPHSKAEGCAGGVALVGPCMLLQGRCPPPVSWAGVSEEPHLTQELEFTKSHAMASQPPAP